METKMKNGDRMMSLTDKIGAIQKLVSEIAVSLGGVTRRVEELRAKTSPEVVQELLWNGVRACVVARATGVSPSTARTWLCGARAIPQKHLPKLAALLPAFDQNEPSRKPQRVAEALAHASLDGWRFNPKSRPQGSKWYFKGSEQLKEADLIAKYAAAQRAA